MFTATETTEADALRQFGEALAAHLGEPGPFRFAHWDEAITRLMRIATDGPTIAVAIRIPALEGKKERTVDGFQVPEGDLAWFGQLLARTGSAGLTAFAGGGPKTAQYLTKSQGRQHYDMPAFAATASVHDAHIMIGDTKFVGTDHVFRMETVRIEAFSGMAEDLYDLISNGRVEEYRHAAYKLRSDWNGTNAARHWNGPISFHDDGTVMALSILPIRRRHPLRTTRPVSRSPVQHAIPG